MSLMRWVMGLTCFAAAAGNGFGDPLVWKNSVQAGMAQQYAGHFPEAETLLRSALEESRRDGNTSETAETFNHLGDVYLSEDRFTDAEATYSEALSLYKRSSSPEIGAVVALRSLGTAFALEGRDEKALSVLNDALHRAKTSFNGNAELTGEILNSLGMVYLQRRNYKKAESFFLEVVRMKSSAGGRDFLTANALNNLAQIHREQRKYTTAEKEYRQCLEISDALLGPSHPQAAITRSSLGLLYLRMGRLDDAEAQLSESLRIMTQTNPLMPGRIVRILHMLGETYSRQGKVTESEETLARAVAIARKQLNHDPETAAVLEEYSAVLKRSGKTEQARATHNEADRVRAVTDLTVPLHGLR